MGLFVQDDPAYDPDVRQTGFNRYKQLLSLRAGQWIRLNLVTVAGALPLAAGIVCALASSSLLILLPGSLLGGMLFGPFLAGLYDAILRGLRDDGQDWRRSYRQSWRANFRDSLLPGAVLGLLIGVYAFMAHLFWWSRQPVGTGTLSLYLGSILLCLTVCTLYWPQVVLFRQTPLRRLGNILLFTAKHLWRVLGTALLELVYVMAFVLFAPWTLLLIPVLGFWYILFVSQLLIYEQMDEAFQIEAGREAHPGV